MSAKIGVASLWGSHPRPLQRLVDPRLPAGPGRSELVHHILVEPDRDGLLRRAGRPAAAQLGLGKGGEHVGRQLARRPRAREILLGPLGIVVIEQDRLIRHSGASPSRPSRLRVNLILTPPPTASASRSPGPSRAARAAPAPVRPGGGGPAPSCAKWRPKRRSGGRRRLG